MIGHSETVRCWRNIATTLNGNIPRNLHGFSGLMRWRLVPYWAKGRIDRAQDHWRTIGDRSCQTSAPRCLQYRRCLIPADGFYEWKRIGPKRKQAYNLGTLEGSVFAFAGLWERWKVSVVWFT